MVCGSYEDTDYFPGADDDVTIVPNATVSTQEEHSSSSSRASSAIIKVGSKRLGHFSYVCAKRAPWVDDDINNQFFMQICP